MQRTFCRTAPFLAARPISPTAKTDENKLHTTTVDRWTRLLEAVSCTFFLLFALQRSSVNMTLTTVPIPP
jgi:hypothetical protein